MSEREDEQLITGGKVINASDQRSSDLMPSAVEAAEAQAKKKKIIKWGLIGGAITIVVVLAIVLPIVLSNKGSNPGGDDDNESPYIYNPYTSYGKIINTEDSVSGYIYSEEPYKARLHSIALSNLVQGLQGQELDPSLLVTYPKRIPEGENNRFIRNISYNFAVHNPSVGILTMTDAENERYSIPEEVVNKPKGDILQKMEMLGFKLFTNPFGFQYEDLRDQNNVYVHTNASTLVMMDKFIQMDLQLPSQRMYGFGERVHGFALGEGTWTMWAKGADSPIDDGTGNLQVYGVHPFILVQGKKKGDFFGMWFRNSNAQSPLIKFNETSGGSTLSYIAIGGQIEIVFFMHGSAKSVIQLYHNLIGNPELPPFWSLGWNQASWAYDTQEQVEAVVANYKAKDIPLETMWLDITYMDKYADFSVDTKAFPDLKKLAKDLHDNRQQLVVILDAGLSADNLENKYYQLAQDLDVLIKSSIHPESEYNGALVMKVWPDHTVFLDWLHPNVSQVWHTGLKDLYDLVPYDGLWIDMNEATGFTDGELDTTKKQVLSSFRSSVKRFLTDKQSPQDGWYTSFPQQNENSTWFLPFVPGYGKNQQNFDHMTLSLNATHPSSNWTEYELHNLYGLMMAEHTRAFLTGNKTYEFNDNRPFILTRSTFSGSGKYASHWLGDNWRKWEYMTFSIAGIMNMNMFGIPHVGADVCGFFGGDMDQEMCARWIQLGTFYPFARGHYNRTDNGEPLKGGTEPYNLENEYLTMARDSIHSRFQYLRHMYTCLFEARKYGGTCFDPLFYYYPEDEKLFENIESSFMIGGAIKVTPILAPGVKDTFEAYFPKGKWVNLADFSEIIEGSNTQNLKARTTVNAHLRPGSLIPFQDNSDYSVKKTAELFEKPISIIANRDEFGRASGTLLLDKGKSRSELHDNQYEYYTLNVQANSFQKQLTEGTHGSQKSSYFDKLVLVNAEDLKDVDFACGFSIHFDQIAMKPVYDEDKKTLTIAYQSSEDHPHLPFAQFRQINYGIKGKDLNLCDEKSYMYHIKGDKKPDLSKSKETFILESNGTTKLPDLEVTLQIIETSILNVKWTFAQVPDGYRKPFEVPNDIINVTAQKSLSKLEFYLDIIEKPSFGIKIQNHRGDYVVSIQEMLLDNNINIIEYVLNTTKGENFTGIFGLGERVQGEDWFYKDGIYSMWNRDYPMTEDKGKPPGTHIYGTHPFFMFKNADDTWAGVFTNLAAAQDWIIQNNQATGEVDATVIAAGGIADLYFIIDSTPAQVLSAYLDIVGKPVLLPQWALGWHQCRWGYNTTSALEAMVEGYADNQIPLDTAWSDIDYLYNYRDFTYDSKQKFKNLPTFIEGLHNKSMQYVPILDAGIAMRAEGEYPIYDEGVKQDVFIKIKDDQIAIGKVWPKDAAYPDFFNPKTTEWWKQELTYFHKEIQFDGLWEDMNEASNFCGGVCYPEQEVEKPVRFNLSYTPTSKNLEHQSIPLDAYHYDGYLELDVHSLFGIKEVQATHEWFKENNKRTFIIERSSYAGIGKFGSKWLGDNQATTFFMGQSVLGVMSMNMFGVPFTGSDICGFAENTNAELCARWHYVGAFQPFSRNHNGYQYSAQEPYVFADIEYEPGVVYMDIMRDAILTKYSLIRYYYTQLFTLSTLGGSPFYKPLFFEYPNDVNAFKNMKYNVMLGDSLKLSMLSDKTGQNYTDFYFPAGTWCNIFNTTERCFDSKGETKNLRTKAQDAYVHIREGKVVPLQDAKMLNTKKTLTTKLLQEEPVDLHIVGKTDPYSEAAWFAQGIYINDNGVDVNQTGTYNRYQFVVSEVNVGDLSKIIMTIATEPATKYQDRHDTDCYAINKNDYLHQIFIYNAKALGLDHTKFMAFVYYMNEDDDLLQDPKYDPVTDRLVINVNAKRDICLSTIKYLEVHKKI